MHLGHIFKFLEIWTSESFDLCELHSALHALLPESHRVRFYLGYTFSLQEALQAVLQGFYRNFQLRIIIQLN